MNIKNRLLIWLLRNHRPIYLKLKKVGNLDISRDDAFWKIHIELLQDNRAIQTLAERYNLYQLVKATSRMQGALAEAGVYRGGSAKILCKVKESSPLYLFDTFEGMPDVNPKMDPYFTKGIFQDTRYEDVISYLSAFSNVHVYKGFFPDSAMGQEPERQTFRFVHLDLDIYKSTFEALAFFYPRMARGGVVLSHDYSSLGAPGVKKAFADFFFDKPETIIPVWDTQCVVVKA
jgi:O-methyltransferase